MAKFEVVVQQVIEVELDETKFTPAFMEEYREFFYPFYSLQDHAEHIAQMQARGVIDLEGYVSPHAFVEGYGLVEEMGIKVRVGTLDFV